MKSSKDIKEMLMKKITTKSRCEKSMNWHLLRYTLQFRSKRKKIKKKLKKITRAGGYKQ